MQQTKELGLFNKLINATRTGELKWRPLKDSDMLPINLAFEDTNVDYSKSFIASSDKLNFILANILRTSMRDGSKFSGLELTVTNSNDEFYIPTLSPDNLYELQTDIILSLSSTNTIFNDISKFLED